MKTFEELKAIVDALEPQLRETALQAEAECNVPSETIAAIKDTGLFRLWAPAKVGGWEVDPVTACRIFEEISYIYGAAGWVVQMSNAVGALARFFCDQAVEEFSDDGNNLFADAFNPPGAAIAVDGGYRLTGQFPFGSGCKHAHWFISLGVEMDGDQPRMENDLPVVHMMMFPMSDAVVVNNWDTLGMRGTGSHDVKVEDIFVPEYRAPLLVPVDKGPNDIYTEAFQNLSIWQCYRQYRCTVARHSASCRWLPRSAVIWRTDAATAVFWCESLS